MDALAPARTLGERLSAAVRRGFTLDVRGLAALRIALGAILLVDGALRTRDFTLMFAPDGVFPPDLVRDHLGAATRWSLVFLHDATWWAGVVLALEGVAGALLLAGRATTLATLLGWVAVVSLIRRAIVTANAGDMWLACQLFWCLFLPLGAVWSIDARRRRAAGRPPPARDVCSVATVALVLQVAAVYLGAGLSKCNATWFSGAALGHALSVHDHGGPLGMALARAGWALRPLTWAVLAAELAGPVALVLFPAVRARAAIVTAFILFHVAIMATMRVGLFAVIGIAAWLPLIPGPVWDRFARLLAARDACLPGRFPPLPRPAAWACAAGLATAVLSFGHLFGPWRNRPLPRGAEAAIDLFAVRQDWGMFGYVPPQEQWVYGRAVLADGREVDLLRGGRPLEAERPADGFGSLGNHRWHKFYWILPLPTVRPFGDPAAAALARAWNRTHGSDEQVRALEIRYARLGASASDTILHELLVATWPARTAAGTGNLDRLLPAAEGWSDGRVAGGGAVE